MTMRVMSDAGTMVTYDKVEIDNLIGNGLGLVTAGTSKRAYVTVLTAGWTSDALLYKDAAAIGETWHYADLAHNLGSDLAVAVAGMDIDGFTMEETSCQKQINGSVLRIWLARPPGYTTYWLVVG